MAQPRKRKVVKEELTPPPSLSPDDGLQKQVLFSNETKLYCFDCRKLSLQKAMVKDKKDMYRCKTCSSKQR